MSFNQPLGGNEMPRFGGPVTFMRLPAAATAEGLDVAFCGIPMDIGTSNRPGTRLGPRQIRDESRMLRPFNMATGAAPFDHLQCADIGDVAIIRVVEIIADTFGEICFHILLTKRTLRRALREVADTLLYPVAVAEPIDQVGDIDIAFADDLFNEDR